MARLGRRQVLIVAATALPLVSWLLEARAMPAPSEPVPISRLTHNLAAYLRKHPGDPPALFTLGRVHYFAYASRLKSARTFHQASGSAEKLPVLSDRMDVRGSAAREGENSHGRMSDAERLTHVREAIRNLWRAHELNDRPVTQPDYDRVDPLANDPGLYELCLACALAEGAPDAARAGVIDGVPLAATPQQWREEALRLYGVAFDRSAVVDSSLREQPLVGALISCEAALSYRRTLSERGGELTAEEAGRLDRIERHLAWWRALPRIAVTPIVLSLAGTRTLAQMIDQEHPVRFDLDGTGRMPEVPWPRPDAALLVWDPEATGHITSGRQLFGSVTWWMFWRDGYEPLAALDDDADGWLSGPELRGIGLWYDLNHDGTSGPGEVIPVTATPIARLRVRATGRVAGSPVSSDGVRLRDGRSLPTYDWVVTPSIEPKAMVGR